MGGAELEVVAGRLVVCAPAAVVDDGRGLADVAVVGGGDRDVAAVVQAAVGEGGRVDQAAEAAAAVLQVAAGVGPGGQPQLEADGGFDVALHAAVLGVGAGRGDDGGRGDVRGGAREGEPADQVAAGGDRPDGSIPGLRRDGGAGRGGGSRANAAVARVSVATAVKILSGLDRSRFPRLSEFWPGLATGLDIDVTRAFRFLGAAGPRPAVARVHPPSLEQRCPEAPDRRSLSW